MGFYQEQAPPVPVGANTEDFLAGLHNEINITGGVNIHAGTSAASSDLCIIIGTEYVPVLLTGDPARQPGTEAGANYMVPGFDGEDTRSAHARLMEALACVKRRNNNANVDVTYNRTGGNGTIATGNPAAWPTTAQRNNRNDMADNYNPNIDGVGIPWAKRVSGSSSNLGDLLRRIFQ